MIVAFAASAAFAGPAAAADMPARVKAPPLQLYGWSGCYMGLNAGYGWGRNSFTDAIENAASGAVFRFTDFDLTSNGWFGGSQIGCNVQWAEAVFGIETDFQAGNVKGNALFPNAIFNFPSATFNTAVTSELRSFGTVRGRIGYSFAPWMMLYATGGFAYGEIQSSLSFPFAGGGANPFIDFTRRTQYGYAAGGGWEALVTPRLSVKAEYLYVDLGARTHGFLIAGDVYGFSERMRMHTFKLGVNFLLPWAVVARD